MSADPLEIAKFDALAKDWWDLNGPMKPLHQLNPWRLSAIEQRMPLAGLKICDVGCGGGILSEALAKRQAHVTGIDLSEQLIKIAQQHAKDQQLNIDYRLTSSTDLASEYAGEFDLVVCMELLEHVPNPDELIADCATLIKAGGMVVFATINRNWHSFFKAIVGAEYLLQLLPKGTHEYAKFIRPSELTLWASRHHLSFQDMQGIAYNPFADQFKFTDDVSVNYMAFFKRPEVQ